MTIIEMTIFELKKTWILAAPLVVAGIGYLLEILLSKAIKEWKDSSMPKEQK